MLGDTVGSEAFNFRNPISPKTPTETPLGDLVKWSTEGNVNQPGDGLGYLIYRRPAALPTLAAGNNDQFTGAAPQRVDIGASAVARSVRVSLHVHDAIPRAQVSARLMGATTPGGSYAEVDSSLRLNTAYGVFPRAYESADYNGVIRQHLGLRLVLSGYTVLRMTPDRSGPDWSAR